MSNYSKTKVKRARGFRFIVILGIVFIVLLAVLFIVIACQNTIVHEKVNTRAKDVSDDVAGNSTPIILNNLVLGGVYNHQWVSAERYYWKSKYKADTKLSVYNKNGKAGTYTITDMKQDTTTVSVLTTNLNPNDEFIAVGENTSNLMPLPATEVPVQEIDYDYAKEALGLYRILNPTIRVTNAYEVSLENSQSGKILIVTNQIGKSTGGYSAVIYVDIAGKSQMVKYSYVRDLDNASDWAIYRFIFAIDLNGDTISELILQETKEFTTKYAVMEYQKNQFQEVLSTEIKVK